MMKWFLIFLLSLPVAFASEHYVINTLGASKKGQFVALEEYGYHTERHTYFVTIRIMNVWTKEYVGRSFKVEIPAHRPIFLEKARHEARARADSELRRFNISG